MSSWAKPVLCGLSVAIAMGFAANPFAQGQAARYDLLLKGGHVIDPANDVDRVADVAITAGKIAAVRKRWK
jgi:adenine deaminase